MGWSKGIRFTGQNVRRYIIGAEALVILIVLVFTYISVNQKSESLQIDMSQWQSDYISYQDGVWQVEEGQVSMGNNRVIDLLHGPYFNLPKGDYTVTVIYTCEESQAFQPFADNGSNANSPFLKTGIAVLSDILSPPTLRLEVGASRSITVIG